MVENSRTSAGAGRLQRLAGEQVPSGLVPLNQPHPAAVETGSRGEPRAVLWRGSYQRVAAIHDSWRIDDEWWRDEIARRYFVAELANGRRLTVYHDLVADAWYVQPYEGPRSDVRSA